jgi:hypothetical protein
VWRADSRVRRRQRRTDEQVSSRQLRCPEKFTVPGLGFHLAAGGVDAWTKPLKRRLLHDLSHCVVPERMRLRSFEERLYQRCGARSWRAAGVVGKSERTIGSTMYGPPAVVIVGSGSSAIVVHLWPPLSPWRFRIIGSTIANCPPPAVIAPSGSSTLFARRLAGFFSRSRSRWATVITIGSATPRFGRVTTVGTGSSTLRRLRFRRPGRATTVFRSNRRLGGDACEFGFEPGPQGFDPRLALSPTDGAVRVGAPWLSGRIR